MHGCFCRAPVREPTPPEVRAAREREKELAELDRDIRTVFAYNLNLKAEEKDLFQFFSTAGKVLDVRIISDRNTRRSKGFAYIEYARRVSRHFCCSCNNSLLQANLIAFHPKMSVLVALKVQILVLMTLYTKACKTSLSAKLTFAVFCRRILLMLWP